MMLAKLTRTQLKSNGLIVMVAFDNEKVMLLRKKKGNIGCLEAECASVELKVRNGYMRI